MFTFMTKLQYVCSLAYEIDCLNPCLTISVLSYMTRASTTMPRCDWATQGIASHLAHGDSISCILLFEVIFSCYLPYIHGRCANR